VSIRRDSRGEEHWESERNAIKSNKIKSNHINAMRD